MSKNTLLSELINYISANSSGNVVVAAPTSGLALDVTGSGRFTGDVTFEGGTGAINFTASTTITNTASSGFTAIYANGGGIYLGGSASVNHLSIASGGAATFSSSVTSSGGLITKGSSVNVNNSLKFLRADGPEMAYIGWSNESANNSTWLFKSSNGNPIALSADGINQQFILTTAGNVGIGTTSPGGLLALAGVGGYLIEMNVNANTPRIDLIDVNVYTAQLKSNGGLVTLANSSNNALAFNTNGGERMRITASGQIEIKGFSTNSLASAVLENGNSNFAIYATMGGGTTKDLFFATGGSAGAPNMTFKANGNLLIGTTTDISYRVNVSGSVYLSNVLSIGSYFEGNCNFSSYTNDGLFSANARPSTITTPSGSQRIKLGYFDYGGGQYYGRIGFAANTNWSLGTIGSAGNDFGIGTGASGQILTITSAGNIGMGVNSPSHRLQVSGNIYSTDTVFGRNLKPEAFVSVNAGTPSGAGIPLGYSTIGISSITDGNWRPILTNINDVKGYFWVTLGDAASKDTANYFMAMTSPAYGVSNFGVVSYQNNGWNTGDFEFTTDTTGGSYRLLVRCTSYYSGGNTAYGTIYFLRME